MLHPCGPEGGAGRGSSLPPFPAGPGGTLGPGEREDLQSREGWSWDLWSREVGWCEGSRCAAPGRAGGSPVSGVQGGAGLQEGGGHRRRGDVPLPDRARCGGWGAWDMDKGSAAPRRLRGTRRLWGRGGGCRVGAAASRQGGDPGLCSPASLQPCTPVPDLGLLLPCPSPLWDPVPRQQTPGMRGDWDLARDLGSRQGAGGQ